MGKCQREGGTLRVSGRRNRQPPSIHPTAADHLSEAQIGEVLRIQRSFEKSDLAVIDWDARNDTLVDAALLVNTTSLGMQGQPPLAIDFARASRAMTVTDIVYVPLETPLLAQGRALGLHCVDGLGMLLYQAIPGFEAWFGVRPVVDDALRQFVASDLL